MESIPALPAADIIAYGRTHVSDHARQAVLLCLSPRISSPTDPSASSPLTVIRPARAGMKQLYTPCGRPGALPAGTVSINGSKKSCQVKVIWSSSFSTVSVQKV